MMLSGITLQNWRNFPEETLGFHPGVNLFSGNNAQGKTNLLEAVELLSSGSPFRALRDREAIRFDCGEARVTGDISGDRAQTVEIRLSAKGKKTVLLDGSVCPVAELWGRLPTVLFCPEDLDLIKAGPAARRKLLNQTLCQLRPRYGALLSSYNRALAQKTALLKSQDTPGLSSLLDVFDEELLSSGWEIIRFRSAFVRLLMKYAPPLHAAISGGERLWVEYKTVSAVTDGEGPETKEQYRAHLASHRAAELASGVCLSGPHRDDLCVSIDGREARVFSSQGQCRTAAIALKLSCRDLLEKELGQIPLLLLDDILSELDSRRQDFVLNGIDRGQIFITDCDAAPARKLKAGRIFDIRSGRVSGIMDF